MAQPHDENVRLGHRTVTCAMARRWCREGVHCDSETEDKEL